MLWGEGEAENQIGECECLSSQGTHKRLPSWSLSLSLHSKEYPAQTSEGESLHPYHVSCAASGTPVCVCATIR